MVFHIMKCLELDQNNIDKYRKLTVFAALLKRHCVTNIL